MEKLTLTAVRTFVIVSTVCIIPLTAVAIYEIFREKTLLTPMIDTPFVLSMMLISASTALQCYMKKHGTKELIPIE